LFHTLILGTHKKTRSKRIVHESSDDFLVMIAIKKQKKAVFPANLAWKPLFAASLGIHSLAKQSYVNA